MKWKPSPSAVFSDLDGMTALLDTSRNVYFCLSGTGPFIWDTLRSGATVPEMSAAITSCYDVSDSVAHADVVELVNKLSAAGLIVAADAE